MLNEEVVREIDALAHQLGTNRSALINQILAEYVNYTTPERRINDVLSAIDQLMRPTRDLVPFFVPNASSLSLKSSLEYKYRPTVKYEVELYRGGEESIGSLSVVFRTQSEELLSAMEHAANGEFAEDVERIFGPRPWASRTEELLEDETTTGYTDVKDDSTSGL